MDDTEKYVNELFRKAKEHLAKNYKLSSIKLSEFQIINFYLIERALNENKNVFIQSYDKELSSDSLFPTVLSITFSLFLKNYIDYNPIWQVGDIVLSEEGQGLKYKIESFKNNEYTLISANTDSNSGKKTRTRTKTVSSEDIKKCIVLDLNNKEIPTDRRTKSYFNDFKKLYEYLHDVKDIPYQFRYNAAIIVEKKDFEAEVKNQEYIEGINIKKAIPMRWFAKRKDENDSSSKSWFDLPIKPMIYCFPDFETYKENILDEGKSIDTLFVCGSNKYNDDTISRINRVLREERLPQCIIIGSAPLQNDTQRFLSWRWTYREVSVLNNAKLSKISCIPIKDSEFELQIQKFIGFLETLESDYSINLRRIKSQRTYLFPLTLSKRENSRNINRIDSVKQYTINVSKESIEENLDNQNKDSKEVITQAIQFIDNIFESFKNEKYELLINLPPFDILIVPKDLLSNWKEEFKTSAQILTFKEFIKSPKFTSKIVSRVVFLSLFNNDVQSNELIEKIINSHHHYTFISYKEEETDILNRKNKFFNDAIAEYQSEDREKISGLKYKITPKEVNISDIIEDLYTKSSNESREYDFEEIEEINYSITFEENDERIILNGTKSVLISINNTWVKNKVSNLRPSDKVRVYNNLDKEKLFNIANNNDQKGRFDTIDNDSKLWKTALLSYYKKNQNNSYPYTEDDLLKALQKNGLSITNPTTIQKWLNLDDKNRFPSSNKNLLAIKRTIDDQTLNENIESIQKSRADNRKIMIALGRDLSDEVIDYIVNNGKIGKILTNWNKDELPKFIQEAAPIRQIKSISITDEDE